MRSVRNQQIFLWIVGVAVLAWSCGGSGSSPTAPPSFDESSLEQVSGNMGPPPGKGKNKGADISWSISAAGGLTGSGVPGGYTMPAASSMTFRDFKMDMGPLASGPGSVADAATCFTGAFNTGDDLIVEADRKDPTQLQITYRFGGFRLDGGAGITGSEITYEIVFNGVAAASSDYSPPWPPQVGTVTLTASAYHVRGVAQKNNTCNGDGSLPDVAFTLVGGPLP